MAVGWLVGSLAGWLAGGWLVGSCWLVGWLLILDVYFGCLFCCLFWMLTLDAYFGTHVGCLFWMLSSVLNLVLKMNILSFNSQQQRTTANNHKQPTKNFKYYYYDEVIYKHAMIVHDLCTQDSALGVQCAALSAQSSVLSA